MYLTLYIFNIIYKFFFSSNLFYSYFDIFFILLFYHKL
jgi:hypothetical protein